MGKDARAYLLRYHLEKGEAARVRQDNVSEACQGDVKASPRRLYKIEHHSSNRNAGSVVFPHAFGKIAWSPLLPHTPHPDHTPDADSGKPLGVKAF